MAGWRSRSRKAASSGSTGAFPDGQRGRHSPLPFIFDADRALMLLHRGAELAVIVDVQARPVGQAQRRRRTDIGAVLAFADALQGDAFGAETDQNRAEILRDIVDEFAVGGQIEDLL